MAMEGSLGGWSHCELKQDHRGHTLQSCSSGQAGLLDLDLLGVRVVTRADHDLPPLSCLYLFSPCFLSSCFSSLDFVNNPLHLFLSLSTQQLLSMEGL